MGCECLQRVGHSLVEAAPLPARAVQVLAAQTLGLQQEPLSHLRARHRIELAPQMHHAVVAVPETQPPPCPLPPIPLLAIVSLAPRRPTASLTPELIGRQSRGLSQQLAVLLHLLRAGLLACGRESLGVGHGDLAALQRVTHRRHPLERVESLDLAGRVSPGHSRGLRQHPHAAIAMAVPGCHQRGRISLQHRHLRPESL